MSVLAFQTFFIYLFIFCSSHDWLSKLLMQEAKMMAIKWLTASNFSKESIRGICVLMLESNVAALDWILYVISVISAYSMPYFDRLRLEFSILYGFLSYYWTLISVRKGHLMLLHFQCLLVRYFALWIWKKKEITNW